MLFRIIQNWTKGLPQTFSFIIPVIQNVHVIDFSVLFRQSHKIFIHIISMNIEIIWLENTLFI